jgi:hypothetical protein
MLMAQARLAGRPLTEAEQARFDEAARRLADLKAHWQVAWERKAAAEFENRMRLWRNFVDDYRTHPHLHFDRYSYEVGRRVQLHLLAQEAGQISAHDQKMLALTDQIVRARLTPTPFIWETEAAPSFDPSVYWFLYGRLPKEPAAQA